MKRIGRSQKDWDRLSSGLIKHLTVPQIMVALRGDWHGILAKSSRVKVEQAKNDILQEFVWKLSTTVEIASGNVNEIGIRDLPGEVTAFWKEELFCALGGIESVCRNRSGETLLTDSESEAIVSMRLYLAESIIAP